jgi:hypothetical protein
MVTNEEWILNFNTAPEDQIDRILRGGIWRHPARRSISMSDEQHTIDVTIIRETEKAVLINDGTREEWLPRSQIEMEGPDPDGLMQLTAPEWILKDKGLI